MDVIYLDNSATTKPHPAAVAKMRQMLEEDFGNPSARYFLGVTAEKALAEAREQVAKAMGVLPAEVYFTSGGTESDNLAVFGGFHPKKGNHVITTAMEHPAVLNCFHYLEEQGVEVTYLQPDFCGNISPDAIADAVRPDTAFVSMMQVNNETGAVLPIQAVKPILKEKAPRALFHVDAVQAFGKLPLNPAACDLMSVSSHKIHGPKGCGALYVRKGVQLKPHVFGGGQEKNFRSGTENVPAICGFGVAASLLQPDPVYVGSLKQRLLEGLSVLDIEHNGGEGDSPYILNVSFKGLRSEILLNALSMEGICVSAGSACASSRAHASYVLAAMGRKYGDNAIRFSFTEENTMEEIETTIAAVTRLVAAFKR